MNKYNQIAFWSCVVLFLIERFRYWRLFRQIRKQTIMQRDYLRKWQITEMSWYREVQAAIDTNQLLKVDLDAITAVRKILEAKV